MNAPPHARVEVLIPHRDRAESLARTLASLGAQTQRPAVCVVDNASSDGTLPMLEQRFPEVRVVPLDRNHGFGAALNRGVATSEAELVVFLNNDAVAGPDFVRVLVEERDRSGADMVAGCLISPDGRVETLGVGVDRALAAFDLGFGLAGPADYRGPPPLGPSGGAALYERAAFERVGGFDEAIFAYLEDVDLALRMRLAGFDCALAGGAVAVHEHSATLGARSRAKNELMAFARSHLLWKYGRALRPAQRFRATVTDAIIIGGKVVIDRDLGSIAGVRRARRARRGAPRPPAPASFARLPLLEIGFRESLRRRLARRR